MLLNNDNTRLTPAGDLEIDVQAVHRVCLYFKPWDQALEVYVNDIDGEVNVFRIDPDIPILSQARNCETESDLDVFVNRIPEQIRRVAARFVFNQTLVLQWAARYKAANDLITSNPILLWLLVNAAQTRYWREAYIRKILSLRQDAIIGELIGTASKPVVKILRKLTLKEGNQ